MNDRWSMDGWMDGWMEDGWMDGWINFKKLTHKKKEI